jgi:hypothetical protein
MNPISPRAAQRDYPHAWSEVQAQIAQLKQTSDAAVIPLGAEIVEVKGIKMLEVLCLTDLVTDDTEMPATGLRIRALLIDPTKSQGLH